jgi:RNA polymerase sigma-70 factor (ECF subfamily)
MDITPEVKEVSTDRNARAKYAPSFTDKEREFVYGVAMKYMKDEERAADVAQDALLSAYLHRSSFRGDSRFTTWLYRIAATTALMHLRRDRRSGRMISLTEEESGAPIELYDPHPSPEDRTGATEAVGVAARHLAEMGDKYGQVFAMRFIDGYSESEIADRLDLQVATVKTRAYRARNHVKRALERALEGPEGLRQAA